MCGRYTVRRVSAILNAFDAVPDPTFDEFTDRPSLFNIAPSQRPPVIRVNAKGERSVGAVRWGLIPHWQKGKPKTMPINARSETAATSGMFRHAMERRRCLVPADGFYEWQGAKPPKQPFFIHLKDDGLYAFAGAWERWCGEKECDEPVDTFVILTTEPNELMAPIHNRMPVILDKQDYDRWLDRDVPAKDVSDLLKPYPSENMQAYKVGAQVNSPRNDRPDLIEPAE